MTIKKFISYFCYTLVMIGALIVFLLIYKSLNKQAEMNYNFIPVVTFSLLYPIVLGVLFALPGLLKRVRKDNAKGFNLGKFLGVGIPAVYVMVAPLLSFTNIISIDLPLTHVLLSQYTGGVMIFSFVFGYITIDCIRRDSGDRSPVPAS